MKKIHVVSVRTLAEFACATGSVTSASRMAARMREGREGHVAVQRMLDERWVAELPVSLDVNVGGMELRVQGRADAAWLERDCAHIAEIKTTRINPNEILSEDYPAHWAQAEIYAHAGARAGDYDLADRAVCVRLEKALLHCVLAGAERNGHGIAGHVDVNGKVRVFTDEFLKVLSRGVVSRESCFNVFVHFVLLMLEFSEDPCYPLSTDPHGFGF